MRKYFIAGSLSLVLLAGVCLLIVVASDHEPKSMASSRKTYVPSSIDNFFDVTSFGETFWIVGGDGVVVKGDKQNRLTEIKIDTHEDLLAVSFSDPEHGWVVGTNGLVFRTSDGGGHWTRVDTGIDLRKLNLSAVKALSKDTVLIAGEKGSVLKSTDAGTRWSNVVIPEDVNVSFIDQIGGNLLAGGEFGSLFIHKNNKWKKVTVNKGMFKGDDWMNPEILTGATDLGRERLGVVGSTGNTYVFNLRSESVESARNVKVPLYGVSRSNSGYVACGEFGKIFYSGDFVDWKEAGKDVDLNIFIRSLRFLDGESPRGLAVGGYGTIMTTNDGGKKWARL